MREKLNEKVLNFEFQDASLYFYLEQTSGREKSSHVLDLFLKIVL